MKSISRVSKVSIALAVAFGASLGASPPAAAQSTTATWTLNDYNQRVCSAPGTSFTYFLISLSGTWSVPLQWSLSGVQPGWSYYGPGTIPPGSGTPGSVQEFVGLNISVSAPEGDYTMPLIVTDGAHTQSVPLLVRIRSGCYGGWPPGMN